MTRFPSYSWMNTIPLYIQHVIHSSIVGTQIWFQILVIMNNTAMSMRMHVSPWDTDFLSFRIYLEVGFLSYVVVLFFFFFGGNFILFSIMARTISISINSAQGSLSSTFWPTLVFCCLFDKSHPGICKVTSHCNFDLHFPDDKWC